jgi:hypothetical protein
MPYTAATMYPTTLKLFQWSTPSEPNPRLAAPVSSTDTTLTFTSPPLDYDGVTVISGSFLMGAKNAEGYVETIWVPAGAMSADGLTATGVVRGIRLTGLDYTTSGTSLAVDLDQDAPVCCNISAVERLILAGAFTGTIASGGTEWKIGKGADDDITVTAYNADANKPFFRYDKTTNQWIYSNDGSSSTPFGTGAGVTGGDGITVTAGDIDIDTSDTTIFKKTSAGAGDENKAPILDASGKLASGFMTSVYSPVDVQEFSYTGSPQTWTKPTVGRVTLVIAYGGGGGGGGGRGGNAGTSRRGGTGGGGGARIIGEFRTADLGATETVTIGAGGTSGAGGSGGNGSNGGIGGTTTFGSHLSAFGGGGGVGGAAEAAGTGLSGGGGGGGCGAGAVGASSATSAGGYPGVTTTILCIGTQGCSGPINPSSVLGAVEGGGCGGYSDLSNPAINAITGGPSMNGGAGGGAGGAVLVANTECAGGAGGAVQTYGIYPAAGGGGAVNGGAGAAGSAGTSVRGGTGGAGGGSQDSGTGGAGGAGGACGGGGGGGGAGTTTGGAGGVGGAGKMYVYTV